MCALPMHDIVEWKSGAAPVRFGPYPLREEKVKRHRFLCVLICSVVAWAMVTPTAVLLGESQFELTASPTEVTVNLNGKLFTRYVTDSGTKPILWPIIGPTGDAMTRSYPLQTAAGSQESTDHSHHRSLWFTHGDVNGLSFWDDCHAKQFGVIRHRRFRTIEGGSTGVIVAESEWVAAHPKQQNEPTSDNHGATPCSSATYEFDDQPVICSDVRRITFAATQNFRTIDFEVTLQATSGPVRFGDTKEGSFGLRVPDTMCVDKMLGGKIVNREGCMNEHAWGKRSAWVDYHGPASGPARIVGIAVMHHPQSFRFPTYWHVRTYGLFAANPFGAKSFGDATISTDSRATDGAFELQAGQSFQHRYRIVLHDGDEKAASIEELFRAYAESP